MPKLSTPDLYDFGQQLVETLDLDPVYVVLWDAELDRQTLLRYLVAYWCFYHMGTAAWISESETGYWRRFWAAAKSKEYPRGRERRHFRGANAYKSTEYLEQQGVGRLLQPFTSSDGQRGMTAEVAMKIVKQWVGFGPWIAFKVADMLERLDVCPIRFDTQSVFLFDSPKEGAEMAWRRYHRKSERPDNVGSWAVESILSHLGGRLSNSKAPPRYDRQLGAQEAETVLCKWKSCCGGHYRLGEDIEAVIKSLIRFSNPLSKKLLEVASRSFEEIM